MRLTVLVKQRSLQILLPAILVLITACSDGTNEEMPLTGAPGTVPPDIAQAVVINDSGIDQCLDSTGALVDCASSDLPFGQDGETGRDSKLPTPFDGKLGFRFVKLDAQGKVLNQAISYQESPWSCIRDETTGYMWEVKTADQSLRDYRWTYTWYDSRPLGNIGDPGDINSGGSTCFAGEFCNSEHYVQALNKAKLCGFDDWRLPNLYELRSIRDYGTVGAVPAIDTSYFVNDPAGLMWTDVGAESNSLKAYALRFSAVYTTSTAVSAQAEYDKAILAHVRAVRGGTRVAATAPAKCLISAANPNPSLDGQQTPTARFIINTDGTVEDKLTGLMWKRCAEGQVNDNCVSQNADQYTSFAHVLDTAKKSNFAGYLDWRVPNIKELNSIVEPLCRGPAINSEVFPGVSGHAYWTSSPIVQPAEAGTLWYVHFQDGANYTKGEMDLLGAFRYLRLVRDNR